MTRFLILKIIRGIFMAFGKKPAPKAAAKKPAAKAAPKKAEAKKPAPKKAAKPAPKQPKPLPKKSVTPISKAPPQPAKAKAAPKKAAKKPEPKKPTAGAAYHLSKREDDGLWVVKLTNSTKVIKTFDTKAEAEAFVKGMAERQGRSVLTHNSKGKNKGRIQSK